MEPNADAPILIALGGADCVWDDLAAAVNLIGDRPYDVAAVNDAGATYEGELTLWCSLHPEKMGQWAKERKQRGGNMDFVSVCHAEYQTFQPDRKVQELWSGSSGLYVCQIAIMKFRYERVLCCGIPMTQTPHFHSAKDWQAAGQYQRGWKEGAIAPPLAGRIRSMSGWTAEFVGRPDDEWLGAVPQPA